MIAVTGEALIDLIVTPDGRADPRPGGGPFNVARTIGRLGLAPAFLGRLSQDRFGGLLAAALRRDGVEAAIPRQVPAPTTLAVAEVGAGGAARYRFYLEGTSAGELDDQSLAAALREPPAALHAGTLGLVMEPAATSIERLILTGLPPGTLVMIDPNCRPGAIPDRAVYLERLWRLLRRADVVKVSTEDLAYLAPGVPAGEAAQALLAAGPGVLLLTDGPRPARALLAGHEVSVAAPAVHVADTIGAGDALGGAFLAWWIGNKLGRPALREVPAVREALQAAVGVASLTCTRAGAEPPWAAELAGLPGWRWLPGASAG
jgi:fructokinase